MNFDNFENDEWLEEDKNYDIKKYPKKGYLQCPYSLLYEVEDVRIAVLAHSILYKCTKNKNKSGFVHIYDRDLAETIYVTEATMRTYCKKLKSLNLFTIRKRKGKKEYKINIEEYKKYFNF